MLLMLLEAWHASCSLHLQIDVSIHRHRIGCPRLSRGLRVV